MGKWLLRIETDNIVTLDLNKPLIIFKYSNYSNKFLKKIPIVL